MRYIPLILLLSIACTGCGYDRYGPEPEPDAAVLRANTTLASVERFYRNGGTDLPEGTVVSGRVTTSDSAGNIYKMVVIQQAGVPLAILTGTYDAYTAYRPGQQVAVQLDGLRVGLWEGMLAVGAPEPGYPKGIDYISSEAVLRQVMVRTNTPALPPTDTLKLTVPEVTAALAGRLVRVTGGSFMQGGAQTWAGEKTYSVRRGVSLTVYTSDYATFANSLLPEGPVDLTGIVTVYKDKVQIKVSSTDDVRCSTD